MLVAEGAVVSEGMTLGTDSILGAGLVLLLVTGEQKAAALQMSLSCAVGDPRVPAAVLRMHEYATVCICDHAAYSKRVGPRL